MAPTKDVTKVVVGVGNLYVAEYPTPYPLNDGAVSPAVPAMIPYGGNMPAPWRFIGATEEGVSQSFERDITDHRVEEQSAVVLQTVNTSALTYTGSIAEHTLENMVLSFGTGAIESVPGAPAGSTIRRLRFSDDLNYLALLFEGKGPDGKFYRYYIPRITSTATSETSHRRSESKKLLPVTFTAVCEMKDVFVDEIALAA